MNYAAATAFSLYQSHLDEVTATLERRRLVAEARGDAVPRRSVRAAVAAWFARHPRPPRSTLRPAV